jgi:hypothetical protein
VLTDPGDEIIFVDYNTPDDFPTFPEAIQDTLTDAAKRRLRVLRVRPALHARYKERSHLNALEPIARNIALRRSSPTNRWVLSTNTDMIFVPCGAASLSDLAAELPQGLYQLPRFEIPESLWEGFDRMDPAGTIAAVHRLGYRAHLNEVVYLVPEVKFDGPGDFQLAEREELFAIHGFHEDMLLGWHVDANLSKRMFLRYGQIDDLLPHMFGYHCDHTRQVTPAHRHDRVENDAGRFFTEVEVSEIPQQAASWGCPDEAIEEVSLVRPSSHVYMTALAAAVDRPMIELTRSHYIPEHYNKIDYDPSHILPFLLDIFMNAPSRTNIAWFGGRQQTLQLFGDAYRGAGFEGWLLLDTSFPYQLDATSVTGVEAAARIAVLAAADAFVLDFGRPDGATGWNEAHPMLYNAFDELLSVIAAAEERRAAAGKAPRRLVALNAVHNEFEHLVRRTIAAAQTPFSTRIRHGFVLLAGNTGR